ncbi:MAG: nuclear pore complex subunit [Salinivirgaceae bacterium]|nr:MAG: nuclear pore complex subunit [Salinivirgaceae bacterium]
MPHTLIIDSTSTTPEILLDAKEGVFKIIGTSMAEDAVGFFMPVIDWLKEYAKEPNEKTHVEFKMNYFNTASSKLIWEIMTLFQQIQNNGSQVKIDWIFQDDDEEMEEAGEIYAERMDIPINLIIDENN